MFPSSDYISRREGIRLFNLSFKKMFNETFAEMTPGIRQQFIDIGIPEGEIEAKIAKMKADLERKMIIKAQKDFKRTLLDIVKRNHGNQTLLVTDGEEVEMPSKKMKNS